MILGPALQVDEQVDAVAGDTLGEGTMGQRGDVTPDVAAQDDRVRGGTQAGDLDDIAVFHMRAKVLFPATRGHVAQIGGNEKALGIRTTADLRARCASGIDEDVEIVLAEPQDA